MFPRLTLLCVVLLCCSGWLSAQNANPFELLWKTGARETPRVITPPVADTAVAEAPVEIVPDPIADIPVPEAPEVAPSEEITPVDTVAESLEAPPVEAIKPAEAEPATTYPPTAPPTPPTSGTKDGTSPVWLVIIFGIVFSLLAWGISLNRALLKNIYRAALNENLSSLLYREQRFATTQYLYYTVYIIFFVNGGMFLYFLGQYFGWQGWIFGSVWACIGLVTLVYVLRHLTLNILGTTYPVSKEVTHFSFSIVLHNILLGIALIPVNLFLAFGPHDLHKVIVLLGIFLCGLIYIARQFRGLLISGPLISGNLFHFFVYLCAVEILPLFTMVKFFHN